MQFLWDAIRVLLLQRYKIFYISKKKSENNHRMQFIPSPVFLLVQTP